MHQDKALLLLPTVGMDMTDMALHPLRQAKSNEH